MKKKNFFIIIFLLFSLFQFYSNSYELFPFSSFGMYKNEVAENDFKEYSISNPGYRNKDLLLSLGDRRFFIQHQLNKLEFADSSQFRKAIALKLKKYLSKDVLPSDSVFRVKYWYEFSAKKYKSPDFILEIPVEEFRE